MRFPTWLPALLGVLSAVGPISTDMYLPAFPSLEASLGGHPGSAQLTLAAWFAGLAVGQMTQGTLADRYGRRVPLLAGLGIFTIASTGCAVAPDIVSLTVMRALAAFGGSASMVIPRAIIRDLADGHAAARMLSQLMLVMGAAPILAPTLGGLVLNVASWRIIFWIAAVYGLVCAVMVARVLPETLPQSGRTRLGFAGVITRFGQIAVERTFLSHALMGGFAMFATFAFLGGSPTSFIPMFHMTPPQFGIMFGVCAGCFIGASQINPHAIKRFGASRVMRTAVRVQLCATIAIAIAAFSQTTHLLVIAAPVALSLGTMGFIMPNATVGALSRHAAHAGSASALMGTMQFALAAISGVAVGVATDGTARPMAAFMLLGSIGANLADAARRPAPAPTKIPVHKETIA